MFMKCKFRKLQLLGSPSSDNRFQIPAQQNDRVVEYFQNVLKRKQNFDFFEMYFQIFHFFKQQISEKIQGDQSFMPDISTVSQYHGYIIRENFYFVLKLVRTKFEANRINISDGVSKSFENLMLNPLTAVLKAFPPLFRHSSWRCFMVAALPNMSQLIIWVMSPIRETISPRWIHVQ